MIDIVIIVSRIIVGTAAVLFLMVAAFEFAEHGGLTANEPVELLHPMSALLILATLACMLFLAIVG